MISKSNLKKAQFISKTLFFVMITLLLGSTLKINAQSSGGIHGKVVDASTGEGLPGATVSIQGTAIGAATDIEGDYRISNIAVGKHELVVSYIGYKKQVISVDVQSQKLTKLDVKLETALVQGEEIVITGQLQGQAQAINQQISSDQIVNVVSEQKIKELPDANAAEAAGRLPGVAVQRDGGEASKLMIRGLDPKFTKVSVNGVQIPSTNSDSRDVDLTLISQSTLSGIELYKALTPDQDADAIAGAVNLVTGQAKVDQKIQLNLYGIYSGLDKTADQYKIDGQYSNRFFGGFLGVQGGLNAERRNRSNEYHADGWETKYLSTGSPYNQISSTTVQYDHEIRKRYGADLNLDINTGDGGNIKFVNLYSKTTRTHFMANRNYTVEGNVTYLAEATDRNIYTLSNSLIGENHLDALKINWAFSHAYTKNEKPFDHQMRFYENKSVSSGMKNITDANVLLEPGKNLIPYAWNNFSKSILDRAWYAQDYNDERNYDAKADFEYPIRLSSDFAGIVKAGYKFQHKVRNRDSKNYMTAYWLNGFFNNEFDDDGNVVKKDWASSSWPNGYTSVMTDYVSGGSPYPTRTIDDDYLLNPVLDENLVREWYDFNKVGTDTSGVRREYFYNLSSVRDMYKITENIHGTYGMVKMNVGQLITFIAGLRYEYENNDYNAKWAPRVLGEFENQYGVISDTTSTFSKEYWLPNIHLKIKPFEWLDFRFAVTKSISRPDYRMRLPILYINNQDKEIFSANPYLEPAISWNYDASVSLYQSQYGLLTISGFRKNIDNIFYWLNDIKIMNNAQAKALGLPVDQYGPFNQYSMDKPVNTNGTKVWGFEVDLQTHLGFLPGALKNIVVSANVSRIWSKTKYPRFQLVQSGTFPKITYTPTYYETERELNGQTDYTANISLGYDYLGFSGRVSAYFQGKYLAGISNIEYEDTYQKAFSRWDLALKQVVTDYLTVFCNVNNFTNTKEGAYKNLEHKDISTYFYGVSAELGLQVNL